MFVPDVSYAARALLRRPGFTIAAGLSLALGIGATTAVFSVLNAVALRPLPYPDGERLVWITQLVHGTTTDDITITSHFLEWRRQNRSFTGLAAYWYVSRNLTSGPQPLEVQTARASASLLPVLGVTPALGRNFLTSEDYKGRDAVALIGDGLWRRQFAADPHIVGRPVTLDGLQYTVVGVLPRDFAFPGPDPVQVITPLAKDEAAELQHPSSFVRNVVGRLRPGVTIEAARAELTVIQSRLALPDFRPTPTITLLMMPLRERLFGNAAKAGAVLVAAAGFLLLIACANVSHLLLVRLIERDRELAIRTVLGGSRARLMTQLLMENGLLGALACGAGILVAYGARYPLLAWNPYGPAGWESLPFDGRVLGFGLALGMLTTLLFGVAPALRATGNRLAEAIRAGAAPVVGGRGAMRLLSLIAAGEIATLAVLATGAGLMLESFWKIRYANLGFQPGRLVAATLNLTNPRYRDRAQQFAFVDQLLERAQAIPGVEAATVTQSTELPPGFWHATNLFAIEGRPQQGPRPFARYPVVTPAYFDLMGVPLIKGRLLQDSDNQNAPAAVVINQELARRYFAGENPLGRRIRLGPRGSTLYEIVGIVGNVKSSGLAAAPEPAMYLAYRQSQGIGELAVILRCALDPAAVARELRRAVTALDPHQPVATIQTMNDRLSESVSKPRFTTAMLAMFACLAALLGVIGVYGVMSCRAGWQTRELAVRQALGAQPSDVIRHVLRQGLAILTAGAAAGVLGSLALGRLISSLLYEVRANDPWMLAAAAGLAVAVALPACWIPAARSARVDLLTALRQE